MALDLDAVSVTLKLIETGSAERAAADCGRTIEQVLATSRGLEHRLGVRLLSLVDGSIDRIEPTHAGRLFVHRGRRLLEEERHFLQAVTGERQHDQLRVFASHYLASYLLIDLIAAYRRAHPEVLLRLSVRTEQQIMGAMLQSTECAIGFCAPVDFPEDVAYTHWFDMNWSLVVPLGHRLAKRASVSLVDLADEELILFEAGSTGRQHVLEAFHAAGSRPRIGMQATTTSIIVQMVEAGLGVSLLPLLQSGRVTAGSSVQVVSVQERLQPIQSGIFVPSTWAGDPLVQDFIAFARGPG